MVQYKEEQIKNGFCGLNAQKLKVAVNPLFCKTLVSGWAFIVY